MSSAVGLTVLNFLNAMQQAGLKLERSSMEGLSFSRSDLERGQFWVPWRDTATLFDRLNPHLDDATLDVLVRRHMVTHPAIRVCSLFASSPESWIDLLWRASVAANPMSNFRYSIDETEHHFESRLLPGLEPCLLWHRLTHLAAVHALAPFGGPPLEVLWREVAPTFVLARYARPYDTSAAERRAEASQIPLETVIRSLEALGGLLGGALRDGHLSFDESVRGHVNEVATLAEGWGLTLTEARVALSLAEGRTPAQVAQALDISVGTVRVHLKHAYAKTETSGQRELVARVKTWRLA